ncbi:hypothetical protein D3C81_2181090 [compost metagenome]
MALAANPKPAPIPANIFALSKIDACIPILFKPIAAVNPATPPPIIVNLFTYSEFNYSIVKVRSFLLMQNFNRRFLKEEICR